MTAETTLMLADLDLSPSIRARVERVVRGADPDAMGRDITIQEVVSLSAAEYLAAAQFGRSTLYTLVAALEAKGIRWKGAPKRRRRKEKQTSPPRYLRELGLPPRITARLAHVVRNMIPGAGEVTLQEACSLQASSYALYMNLGSKTVDRLTEALAANGLKLASARAPRPSIDDADTAVLLPQEQPFTEEAHRIFDDWCDTSTTQASDSAATFEILGRKAVFCLIFHALISAKLDPDDADRSFLNAALRSAPDLKTTVALYCQGPFDDEVRASAREVLMACTAPETACEVARVATRILQQAFSLTPLQNPKNFEQARKHLGWTQARMGSEMGVDLRTIQKWEGGERGIPRPSAKLLEIIVREPRYRGDGVPIFSFCDQKMPIRHIIDLNREFTGGFIGEHGDRGYAIIQEQIAAVVQSGYPSPEELFELGQVSQRLATDYKQGPLKMAFPKKTSILARLFGKT